MNFYHWMLSRDGFWSHARFPKCLSAGRRPAENSQQFFGISKGFPMISNGFSMISKGFLMVSKGSERFPTFFPAREHLENFPKVFSIRKILGKPLENTQNFRRPAGRRKNLYDQKPIQPQLFAKKPIRIFVQVVQVSYTNNLPCYCLYILNGFS